ncbi:MAG: helix-turn-helix domain-containing protein [Christensenellales bacterium]
MRKVTNKKPTITDNTPIYERVKYLRILNGYSQEQISQKLIVDRTLYLRYENGERLFPLDQLIKIAKMFNSSMDFLVGITNEPYHDIDFYTINRTLGLSNNTITQLKRAQDNKKDLQTKIDEIQKQISSAQNEQEIKNLYMQLYEAYSSDNLAYCVNALFDEDYNQGMRTIDYISSYLKFDEEKFESQSVLIPLKTHKEIVLLDNDKIQSLLLTLIENSLRDLKSKLDNGENK